MLSSWTACAHVHNCSMDIILRMYADIKIYKVLDIGHTVVACNSMKWIFLGFRKGQVLICHLKPQSAGQTCHAHHGSHKQIIAYLIGCS